MTQDYTVLPRGDLVALCDAMSRDERSVMLYAESVITDHGGLMEGVRMNSEDHDALKKFADMGLLSYGRIPSILLGTHGFTQSKPTHWVAFGPTAWEAAHLLRQRRAQQKGPYASSVFEYVAAKMDQVRFEKQAETE